MTFGKTFHRQSQPALVGERSGAVKSGVDGFVDFTA
jgi:hypothetical protein